MPKAIMASIIFAALKNMINIATMRKLWRVSKPDWALFMVAFVGTGLLNVTYGIGVSIGAAVVYLVKLQMAPSSQTLGVIRDGGSNGGSNDDDDDVRVYVDVKRFPTAVEVPGVKIFRFNSSLNFANKSHFEIKLQKVVDNASDRVYVVVVDCSSVTEIDFTCVKMLRRVILSYGKDRGIRIVFGNWPADRMRTMLVGMEFFDATDDGGGGDGDGGGHSHGSVDGSGVYEDNFFVRIDDAVIAAEAMRERMIAVEEIGEGDVEGGDVEGGGDGKGQIELLEVTAAI
jgi:MFS superfamily sulfate permease-like transporter